MKNFIIFAFCCFTTACLSQVTWERVTGIDTNIRALASFGNTILTGTGHGKVYGSTNDGVHWQQLGEFNNDIILSLAIKNDLILVGTYTQGVFYTNDRGLNWHQNKDLKSPSVWSVIIDRRGVFFASTDDRLYTSADEGQTWECRDTINKYRGFVSALDSSGYIYGGSPYGGLYRSTDDGHSFHMLDDSGRFNDVFDIEVNSKNTLFLTSNSYKAFYSSDHGVSWHQADTLPQYYVTKRKLAVGRNDVIFASASLNTNADQIGVYMSTDDGKSWQFIKEGLTDTVVYALCTSNEGYVFAGTSSGVFRTTKPFSTVEKKQGPHSSLRISSNPASGGHLVIGYSVESSTSVTIVLQDVNGRVLKELLSAIQQPGEYEISVRTSDLSSGIYQCIMTQRGFLVNEKILVVK